jgi:hypothetical protein
VNKLHLKQMMKEHDVENTSPARAAAVPIKIQSASPVGVVVTETAKVSAASQPKLFAVYLGGRAPRCNTELHDVVFVVGTSIEQTYERLIDIWFGSAEGLHLDSWMEHTVVDGHRVVLTKTRPQVNESDKKLYFVNLGAYADGEFTELHANAIVAGASEREVKTRAKSELLRGKNAVHMDDLFDIDDCLEINSVDGYHVVLEPTSEPEHLVPNNGYHIIPKAVIEAHLRKQNTFV